MESKKKTTTPKEEPLFISFLNAELSLEYIGELLARLEKAFKNPADQLLAKDRKESLKDHHMEGYRLIQTKFKDHVDYIIQHRNFDKEFAGWANFYLSALKETKQEDHKGNVERFVQIGDPNGDWIVGLILYNFSLFCKYYGKDLLKGCPVCLQYYTARAKYNKYCSDKCKRLDK